MAFVMLGDGLLGASRLRCRSVKASQSGTCDGLKVDVHGNIFTSAPGGVAVLSPEGQHLGTIRVGLASNCCWGDDGTALYVTTGVRSESAPLRKGRRSFVTREIWSPGAERLADVRVVGWQRHAGWKSNPGFVFVRLPRAGVLRRRRALRTGRTRNQRRRRSMTGDAPAFLQAQGR